MDHLLCHGNLPERHITNLGFGKVIDTTAASRPGAHLHIPLPTSTLKLDRAYLRMVSTSGEQLAEWRTECLAGAKARSTLRLESVTLQLSVATFPELVDVSKDHSYHFRQLA